MNWDLVPSPTPLTEATMCLECEAVRFTPDELATAAQIEPMTRVYRGQVLAAAVRIVLLELRLKRSGLQQLLGVPRTTFYRLCKARPCGRTLFEYRMMQLSDALRTAQNPQRRRTDAPGPRLVASA
jgi:hypothetical protein